LKNGESGEEGPVIIKIKELIKKMNESGIPLPLFRINGAPSITATFAIVSFCTALFGQFGKFAKLAGSIDIDSANYLFFGSLAAYLGRRMSSDGKTITVESKDKE
jgi:hypothetical protein